jgi:hypothetical protein
MNTDRTAPSRRFRRGLVAGVLVAGATLGSGAGVAWADIGAPGSPYQYVCGGSRSGGLHVEAAAQTITVDIRPDRGPAHVETRSGSISENFVGGTAATIYLRASNDGVFGPKTRTYCDDQP